LPTQAAAKRGRPKREIIFDTSQDDPRITIENVFKAGFILKEDQPSSM
jgi:hypothetical protein